MVDSTLPVSHRFQIPVTQKVICFKLCIFHYYNYIFFIETIEGNFDDRELTRSLRREVAKLTEQWNHLINRSDNWKHRLDEYMTVSENKYYVYIVNEYLIWHGDQILFTFFSIVMHCE